VIVFASIGEWAALIIAIFWAILVIALAALTFCFL
jgi:hypothetical protein